MTTTSESHSLTIFTVIYEKVLVQTKTSDTHVEREAREKMREEATFRFAFCQTDVCFAFPLIHK